MVDRWEISIPQLSPEEKRPVYVSVPDDAGDTRFPVLYMFDGQNVFYDEDASFGKSWGMAEYLDTWNPGLIIAAIGSSENRMREYSPFTHSSELGTISGLGRTTMNFMTRAFKNMIDERYPTLPDRDNTLIAGSSMGGLMSLYAITHYNHIYGRAACLSPSLWVNERKVMRMITSGHLAPHTLIYMDYGAVEMGNHPDNFSALRSASRELLFRDVDLTFRIVPNGDHSEASWQERIPFFMQCLGF